MAVLLAQQQGYNLGEGHLHQEWQQGKVVQAADPHRSQQQQWQGTQDLNRQEGRRGQGYLHLGSWVLPGSTGNLSSQFPLM
jgi:uncharacterized lipoprotein YmbA